MIVSNVKRVVLTASQTMYAQFVIMALSYLTTADVQSAGQGSSMIMKATLVFSVIQSASCAIRMGVSSARMILLTILGFVNSVLIEAISMTVAV